MGRMHALDVAARDQLEKLVEHYWPQVTLYAKIWQDTIGQPVCEQSLLFAQPSATSRRPTNWPDESRPSSPPAIKSAPQPESAAPVNAASADGRPLAKAEHRGRQ
jgi:hypothetical protein